jgi:hypothetical protein
MCVGCLVVSALTFIVPVSEVPASNVSQPVTASVPTALLATNQVSPGIAAVEKDIQAVLDQLPDSADAEMLQIGLETTLARLDTATSNEQAQTIVDEEVDKLAEALIEAPNAEQVSNILLDIRAQSDGDSLPNETGLVEFQSNGFMLLQNGLQLNQRSGWLS